MRDIVNLARYSAYYSSLFFFQAEDGIRDLVRSRGLGDVYKRQTLGRNQKFSVKRFSSRSFNSARSASGRCSAQASSLSLIHI